MNPTTAYRRRLRAILLDEDYGPRLARLNVADTAAVLALVEANQGRQARALILQLDQARREQETRNRRRRERNSLVSHMVRELVRVGTAEPVNTSTVALGVAAMTTAQRVATAAMDGDELKANAGDRTNIHWAPSRDTYWNVWWYH